MVAPTAVDSRMVTMFISAFCAVSLGRSVAPVSLNRLPGIRQPIRERGVGSSRATKITTRWEDDLLDLGSSTGLPAS